MRWLTTPELAYIAGISERKARAPLAIAARDSSRSWRSAKLIVSVDHGRGGSAGRQYRVRLDSLPLDLQNRWQELHGLVEPALKVDDATMAVCQWRYALIQTALSAPERSPERAAILKDVAGRQHVTPEGELKRVGLRSLQRWLDAFEQPAPHGGFAGLMRKKRTDSGEARVIVTEIWDRAVPFDDAAKHRIAHELRQHVRGLHKAEEALSLIAPIAVRKLAELTRAEGFTGDDAALSAICAVPYHVIRAERAYRKVGTLKNDRSSYENAKPRIERTRAGLQPNDIWVGDVHPVDILYRRPDGSTATVRAIAWLDLATNRLFTVLVALDKGQGGVRNTHVIRSFAATVTAWGAPRALYLDNGSEYNWAEFIQDALKLLNAQGTRLLGDIAYWSDRRSHVIRAMPYNGPAKPIENIFGVLERKYLSAIPGYIGGDRMRKRTQNHGREPEPFPGTVEQLCAAIERQVATYNAMPQVGRALKGVSPNDAWAAAAAAGWRPTEVNPDALRVAFSTEEVRQVRQGVVHHKGRWTSRELQAHQGDTVTLLVPKYEDWARLPVRDEDGRIFTFVERDTAFGIADPAGAIEADARSRAHHRGVVALDRSAPDVDRIAERQKLLDTRPGPPALPRPDARLTTTPEAEDIALNVGLSPDAETARARRQAAAWERQDATALARQAKRRATAAKMQANRAARTGEGS